jgi:hypothetical protein
VVFTQGPTNPDGGWFDASGGKPQIQVKTPDDPQWQTVATLESYPATTATDPRGLEAGQSFQAKLDNPVQITALRILGKPADGNNPKNACSSCAELAGYADSMFAVHQIHHFRRVLHTVIPNGAVAT